MLYITSRRYTERTNHLTNVKIYSNANQVELCVNGESLGQFTNATHCVFVWTGVSLAPGPNRIAARAKRAGQALTDECIWNVRTNRAGLHAKPAQY